MRLGLVLLVLLLGGAATGYTVGLRQAPLGVPLPPRPRQIVKTAGVDLKDMSTIEGRIGERLLEMMAPQPDGTPPLDLRLRSDRGAYSLQFPPGTQMLILPNELYPKKRIDAQVTFKYGQPLFLLNIYLKPRVIGESYTIAAHKLDEELSREASHRSGVSLVEPAAGCPFATFDFVHPGPLGTGEYRQVYVTPYCDYLLVLDFMSKAEHQKLAKGQVMKIMASFQTDWTPAERIKEQDTAPGA